MDIFMTQVGRRIQLQVNSRNKKSSQVSFQPEFRQFDRLLAELDNPTPKGMEEQARTSYDFLEMFSMTTEDILRAFDKKRPRECKGPSGSMRIYHLQNFLAGGRKSPKLNPGDLWEVEVNVCYHNPKELRTKDNRRKIHYGVRPVRKVG